jgi:ribosomal protein L30E
MNRIDFPSIVIIMETITKLPEKKGLVGAREIAKAVRAGKIKHVVVAANCPESLLGRFSDTGVKMEKFDGDESQLGTKLGRPFPVAMVGYEN